MIYHWWIKSAVWYIRKNKEKSIMDFIWWRLSKERKLKKRGKKRRILSHKVNK